MLRVTWNTLVSHGGGERGGGGGLRIGLKTGCVYFVLHHVITGRSALK